MSRVATPLIIHTHHKLPQAFISSYNILRFYFHLFWNILFDWSKLIKNRLVFKARCCFNCCQMFFNWFLQINIYDWQRTKSEFSTIRNVFSPTSSPQMVVFKLNSIFLFSSSKVTNYQKQRQVSFHFVIWIFIHFLSKEVITIRNAF